MMKLTEIVEINPENIGKSDFINYIDIGSVGSGKILNIKYIKNNFPSRAKRRIRKGDIIISTVRPNLKTYAIIEDEIENLVCSTGFVVLRPKDIKYQYNIYYSLTSEKAFNYYINNCEGGNYPAFKASILENYLLPINLKDFNINPIINESKVINKIKTLLEKIEIRNQYYADKLLSGEINIDALGELINEKNNAYIDYKMKDICEISMGNTPPEDEFGGNIPWITISDMNKDIENTNKKLKKGKKTVEAGTLLISFKLSVGVAKITNIESSTNEAIIRIEPTKLKKPVSIKYLYYILPKLFLENAGKNAYGASIMNSKMINEINVKIFSNYNDIAAFLGKLEDEKQKVKRLLELEEKRFEWLSDKLLSGEYIIED